MSDIPYGPSRETLKHLHDMLPSFVKGVKERKSVGKGVSSRPRKVCTVCGTLWDRVTIKPGEETPITSENCSSCKEKLDSGLIAFVCGDSFVFATSTRLTDMAGQVIQVGPRAMEELKKHFDTPKNDANPDDK